jgi:hypothetical protein
MRYFTFQEWAIYADALRSKLGDEYTVAYEDGQQLLDIPGFMLAFKVTFRGKSVYAEQPMALTVVDDASRATLIQAFARRIREACKPKKNRRLH